MAEADGAGGSDGSKRQDGPETREPFAIVVLHWINRALGWGETAAVLVFLAALIFVGAYQAIARNFFHHNPDWVDPIIRSSVFLIGMTGGALAAQADRLINMDLTARTLRPRVRLGLKVVTSIFSAYICWYLYKAGLLVQRSMAGERDENIIKAEHVALALPICTLLIGLHMLLHGAVALYYVVSGRRAPEPPRPVEGHHV